MHKDWQDQAGFVPFSQDPVFRHNPDNTLMSKGVCLKYADSFKPKDVSVPKRCSDCSGELEQTQKTQSPMLQNTGAPTPVS